MATQPSILIIGDPKIGKSTAAMAGLVPNLSDWIVCERGALTPAVDPTLNPWRIDAKGIFDSRNPKNEDRTGKVVVPRSYDCLSEIDPCQEARMAFLGKILPRIRDGKCGIVGIDTISSLVNREFTHVTLRRNIREEYGKANRAVMAQLRNLTTPIFESGAILVALCHAKEPNTIEGKFTPGGVSLPGQLVSEIPSLFDIVVRIQVSKNSDGNVTRIARCDAANRNYITGDRFNVIEDGEVFDLKSILRRAVAKASEAHVL